jgi:hypothetical protein
MVNARQPSRQNLPLLIFKGNSADRKILGFNDYRDRSVDFQSFPREQLVALEKKKTVSGALSRCRWACRSVTSTVTIDGEANGDRRIRKSEAP